MHKARYGGGGGFACALPWHAAFPGPVCVHQPRRCQNPVTEGVLWRLHYIGLIDEIINHWGFIQSLAPLPSLEVGHGLGLIMLAISLCLVLSGDQDPSWSHLRSPATSHLISKHRILWDNKKVQGIFRTVCQELGTETKCMLNTARKPAVLEQWQLEMVW